MIYKHRFFKLETYHNNQRLNVTELYRQLEKIAKTKSFGPGIGALTADTRDNWAKVRVSNMASVLRRFSENLNFFRIADT